MNTYTKGKLMHRAACQSSGHGECRAGPLWRCSNCRREFCAEDGGDNGHPGLCDECWGTATQEEEG